MFFLFGFSLSCSREFKTSKASLCKSCFCRSPALVMFWWIFRNGRISTKYILYFSFLDGNVHTLKISLTNFAFHFIASVSYKIHTSLPFLVLKSTSTLKKETCWIARWKVSSSAMVWTKILLFSQLWFRNLILFIEIICFKSLFVCMFD